MKCQGKKQGKAGDFEMNDKWQPCDWLCSELKEVTLQSHFAFLLKWRSTLKGKNFFSQE